jgi:hypothetical protein
VIRNPEIATLVPTLLMSLNDPNAYTKHSLDVLLQVYLVLKLKIISVFLCLTENFHANI